MLHRRQPRHASMMSGLDTRNIRVGLITSITALLLSVAAVAVSTRSQELLVFVEFYIGVAALVSFTVTVALGLLTTERAFLSPPNRVRAQFVHRVTAVAGLGFLLGHIILKSGRAPWLGVTAALLFGITALSGFVRRRFADLTQPWRWRVLHAATYLAWPVSILHGLTAGRTPAWWVSWSYAACMAAVAAALIVRVWATLIKPAAAAEKVDAPVSEPVMAKPVELAKYRKTG